MLDGSSQPVTIQVPGFTQAQLDGMINFLHGMVHYWCETHQSGNQFSFNTFMGGPNNWQNTPLLPLYNPPSTPVPSGAVNPAMLSASQIGGLMLKGVLREDGRNFRTVSPGPNLYEFI
ncbi:MAG: hypothetical protein LBK61_11600 [Spirochaetaceae bacterium]|jgi:hypothetical protein|nr:hypothetical protein [Spirochaetaceae bacterium]